MYGFWISQRYAEIHAVIQLLPGELEELAPELDRLHRQVRAGTRP